MHSERLASHYAPNEHYEFARAFGLVFGGIPYGYPLLSAFRMSGNVPAMHKLNPPLFEGDAGWNPRLVDNTGENPDWNPAHHYAGLFYSGYFLGRTEGRVINVLRDGPPDINMPDIRLGDLAARHGYSLRNGDYSFYGLADLMRVTLR